MWIVESKAECEPRCDGYTLCNPRIKTGFGMFGKKRGCGYACSDFCSQYAQFSGRTRSHALNKLSRNVTFYSLNGRANFITPAVEQ